MNKRERLNAVLSGQLPDRPPLVTYKHVQKQEATAEGLAEATLEFQEKYDFDIVKIQNRASILQEAWGDRFDFDQYEKGVFPSRIFANVEDINDFHKFTELNPHSGVFQEQIDVIKMVREHLKEDVPLISTVFTPINVISSMLGEEPVRRHFPAYRENNRLFRYFEEYPEEMHRALTNIAHTLAKLCRGMIDAGADGIFYGEIGWARRGYLTYKEWETFVKPYDLIVLNEIKDGINFLHTCGMKSNPERFSDYPIRVIHWDQLAEGNPRLKDSVNWLAKGVTPMGGIDEMQFGTHAEEKILKDSLEVLRENKNLPFIFAPNCSIAVNSYDEEITAFRKSVDLL